MRPINSLSDAKLDDLNSSYPWRTYVVDAKGRKFGRLGGRFHEIPSPHVVACERLLGLSGKSVVEFGCHEGTHTVTLAERSKSVVALDAREENVLKSRVRCQMFGVDPKIVQMDVENQIPPTASLFFHVGVLYHLVDPVEHLRRIGRLTRELYLDTHYATHPRERYRSANGKMYPYMRHPEDTRHPQAGMSQFSRWIESGVILDILRNSFSTVTMVSSRGERNGPRMTVVAKK